MRSVPPALTGGFFGYFLLTATAYVATERMTPPTNAGGTDLISHFALAANGNVSAPKPNKSATDSMNRPHFITPRSKVVGMFAVDYEGLRAADKSCEAPPSLSQAVYRQPCLFALRLCWRPRSPERAAIAQMGSASPKAPLNFCLRA